MSAFLDDLDAMVVSSVFVLAVLACAEFARRRGVSRPVTRKIVHVGIGTWVIPTFLLFEHRLWAVIPPLCFVVVNALSFRFGLIRSVEGGERNVGTILYPMSVAAALYLFWTEPWPAVGAAAILVMAWGDAAGALVGRRFGRRRYEVFGHTRSWEGTAAVALVGWVAVVVTFAAMGQAPTPGLLAAAAVAAGAGAAAEAISLWGFDNVTVPGVVAIALVLTHGGLWA